MFPCYNMNLQKTLIRFDGSKFNGVNDDWDKYNSLIEYDNECKKWLSECLRVLKKDGSLWVIGSFHNIHRLGYILQDLNAWIINEIVWEKINPVPEYSLRNNIWKYTTSCEKDKTGHPAIFPEQLAIDHILSWTNEGDIVYDPFMGSGTTAKACVLTNRKYIGSEISTEYYKIILERLNVVEKYDGKVSYNINSKKTKNEEIKESNEETSLF